MKSYKQILFSLLALATLSGCGIQAIPESKNSVDATLAEVTNQYKRRTDLVPNLVETVKGFAKQESKVLTDVVEARAKATSVQIDISKAKPEDIKRYQEAQGQLGQALGRLLAVQESYPQLKSDKNFLALQDELAGTENRITYARQKHIDAINEFNNLVTVPPTSWVNSMFYHFSKMEQWGAEVTAEEKKAPKVQF